MQDTPHQHSTLGADIRALRKARHQTIESVAQTLGKSVGWLSQVERGISQASAADIATLAGLFEVPISLLMQDGRAPAEESAHIVRAGQRRRMANRLPGLTEELLSPDLTGDTQVLHATFEPRAAIVTPRQRRVEEIGYILSGRLILSIGDTRHDLRRGDSFRIRGEAYTWENPTASTTTALWIVTPPDL